MLSEELKQIGIAEFIPEFSNAVFGITKLFIGKI